MSATTSTLQIVHRNGWYAVRSRGWLGFGWRYWVRASDGQPYSHGGSVELAQWMPYEEVWRFVAILRKAGYEPLLPLGETTPVCLMRRCERKRFEQWLRWNCMIWSPPMKLRRIRHTPESLKLLEDAYLAAVEAGERAKAEWRAKGGGA